MAKAQDTKTKFKVALNPGNPEACSWYSPSTGVNLSLSSPISDDLSAFDDERMEGVYASLRSGMLIVAEGQFPEGFGEAKDILRWGAPRSRWIPELADQQKKALENHKAAVEASSSSS